ncbi:MAG: alkaline phosphatase D family protein, partial [Planctomycetota bacterium]|nr:alkaline phosphatase D family protein [Planctomycetota bacterium]
MAKPSFSATLDRDPIRLTHGPMLGNVTARSIKVWGRTSDAGLFHVRYGTEQGNLDLKSEEAVTRIEDDNTGSVTLRKLLPDTRYYYRVWVNGRPHGIPASFRTVPSPATTQNEKYNPRGLFNFSFEVGSCANQNPLHGIGHWQPAYENLNKNWADKVNFHIMNGDWLYEELREFPVEAWRLQQGVQTVPRSVEVMPSLVGVWENYKLYMSRGDELMKWHRNVPSFFTFDDHELVNDIWGAGSAGKRHRRTVFRDIGTYGWHNYLGWANPTAINHRVHFGRAQMTKGSNLLVDPRADFTNMSLEEMLNLHVHWGTIHAGVNEMKYDNDEGHKNSYVYEIVKVVDQHTLQLQMPAKITDEVSYSIG